MKVREIENCVIEKKKNAVKANLNWPIVSIFLIGEEFEMITSSMVQDEFNSSYQSMVKRKILSIDLSDHSTYVQLGIGSATGWYK